MQHDLTPRELQVLTLLSEGKSSKEIAFQLGMAFRTACCHRWKIMSKLQAHNTVELIRVAVEFGVLDLAPARNGAPTVAVDCGAIREAVVRLDAILEENRRYRETLCQAVATSHAACGQAQDYREQLKEALEGTKKLAASLKHESRCQNTAA